MAKLEVVGFRDAKGRIAHVRFFVASGTAASENTAAGNVVVALAATSNAQQATAHGPATQAPVSITYGNVAQFQNAEDKMLMVFQSSTGGAFHRFQVPAPKASNFLTDLETVNTADANVLGLITAIQDFATDQFDHLLTVFIGGVRIRRKMQKRLNISILGPGDVIETPAE